MAGELDDIRDILGFFAGIEAGKEKEQRQDTMFGQRQEEQQRMMMERQEQAQGFRKSESDLARVMQQGRDVEQHQMAMERTAEQEKLRGARPFQIDPAKSLVRTTPEGEIETLLEGKPGAGKEAFVDALKRGFRNPKFVEIYKSGKSWDGMSPAERSIANISMGTKYAKQLFTRTKDTKADLKKSVSEGLQRGRLVIGKEMGTERVIKLDDPDPAKNYQTALDVLSELKLSKEDFQEELSAMEPIIVNTPDGTPTVIKRGDLEAAMANEGYTLPGAVLEEAPPYKGRLQDL